MRTGKYIVMMLMLLMCGAGEVWADDITVTIAPGITNGTITSSVNQTTREVTLTVKPNNGYYIKVSDIKVEPLVGTGNANAPRRVPDLANLIAGKLYDPNRNNREISTFVGDGTHYAEYKFTVPTNYDGAYVTATFTSITGGDVTLVISANSIGANPDMSGHYILMDDVPASWLANLYDTNNAFTGTLEGEAKSDGTYPKIDMTGYSHALFNMIDGGTVRNIVLENVDITNGTNVGAIANQVIGIKTKIACIYNCGILTGSVSGSGNVGGLVGQLGQGSPASANADKNNCYARVINCYSYANVSGGSNAGGLVGYNSYASKASDIRTMVMNCMFYGDITGGTTKSPVFGGENINNLNSGGLNTFNFYAYEQLPTSHLSSDKYNCALAVEEKYLNRFEFYRLLLNSNKKLAAFYVTGSVDDANQMAKWVLETADRTIANPKRYPILKAQGYYPSIINPDFKNAPDSVTIGRNHGGKLGKTLSVTISGVGSNAPAGATIVKGRLSLVRTDKDFDRFNYNYDKVQLPYYNDVGTGNYTGNRVVTGWKITAITAVSGDPYTASNYPTTGIKDYPDHNYADRRSSNKDLYSVSKRVFSQGAYFDVPYGVTSITIEPYWGKAVYLADKNYDVVYKNDYSGKQDVTQTGTQLVRDGDTPTTFNGQKAETSIENALNYIRDSLGGLGSTVYDNALVLMGNYHLATVPKNDIIAFTMMSVDMDNDHEPDYSLIYHHKGRSNITPIRFDFLNIPGTAQAQKPNTASLICNFTIFKTRGWFEITNTALVHSDQLEYENGALDGATKIDAPLILLGGIFDQFVSTQSSTVNGHTIYIHVGSNVWIKEFGMGTHSDGKQSTPHVPVSVTGGEFPGFYLTGTYNQNAAERSDNAECYISGGYFNEVAGAAQEGINGNVQWQIYNADIEEFFGGGINDAKPIRGDVTVDIYNSHVGTFCGGPKFGNMQAEKKVTTNAEGCVFGQYFGAGYGGNSISRKKYYDLDGDQNWATLQGYYTSDRGKYFDGNKTRADADGGHPDYGFKGPGVATDFDYEFFVWSSGKTGARLFVKFTSFSLAQCNDVESNLKKCVIENNFYGGGSLGKVAGSVNSELEDCTVKGNVFGAGYSATLPQIPVRNAGFTKNPNFNKNSGMFEPGEFTDTLHFTWEQVRNYPSEGTAGFLNNNDEYSIVNGKKVVTTIDITKASLGSVGGNITLTLKDTTVGTSEADASTKGTGNVFGGGDESYVTNTTATNASTVINITGDTEIFGNVFGGGNKGLVSGNATINIQEAVAQP